MGERKSRFRVRLPWLMSSAPAPPAPRPAVVTRSPTNVTTRQTPPTTPTETQSSIQPNANPTTPTQRPPFRAPGFAPAQPSPPQAQTSPTTNSQSTTAQPPTPTTQTTLGTQSPAQLTAAASTPTIQPTVENRNPSKTTSNPTPVPSIPAQLQPLRPPRQAAAQNSLPLAQASPKTESQPSSPSRAGFQSQIYSQPASPSHASTQSRATFQPPSPSPALPQSQAISQPRLPSRVSPQSRAAIQHSPPADPKPQKSSQTVSPARPKPQKSSQTVSQPHLALKPSGQTSSIPSESLIATNVQPTAGTTTQTPSPTKKLNPIESSKPTPSSNNSPSPVSEEQNQAMPPPQSLEAQPMTDITNGIISSSSIEATIQLTATAAQPSEQSGPMAAKVIPSPKKKSDNTVVAGYPKPSTTSDGNPVETEKWKKKTENTTAVAYEASGSIAHTKEQPRVAFQAEEKQLEKQEILRKKEVLNENTSTLNGKQTKTMISHPKHKSMVIESHQKPTTSNGKRLSLQKEIRNDSSKLAHKMVVAHRGQPVEEKPVSVITLIGENRGASMQLDSESAKKGAVHIHRGYKINPNESAEASSDGEESSKGRSKDANTKEDHMTKTHLNSNTQGINNSILFNSSITERNPGVHLTLSRNPTEPIKSNDETESLKARKAEVNITTSEKLTYKPTIRRRCLRGLFMEPSDSDPDNPEKPQRHGCRYSCRYKNKDNEMDVL